MNICSFCGKKISQVNRLIQAPDGDACICDVCAKTAARLGGESERKNATNVRKKLESSCLGTKTAKKGPAATPSEIRRQLDRFIIGQDKAKKVLSVALYNHSKRLQDKSGLIKKSNILLIGPSGCGKTLLARTLARLMDVPFAIADATAMTQAGYAGDDVETCLQRLLDAAGGDVELAQKGVVYLDEIDKIACRGSHRGTADVSGEGVQAALLKLIEGSEVSVPASGSRKNPMGETIVMDTKDILFVCGGAFQELTDGNRKSGYPIGFLSEYNQPDFPANPCSPDALVRYGMMPEFIGRLPVICTLEGLTEDDMVRILTEPEDAVTKEFELLLKKDRVKLVFEPEALSEIARSAVSRNTGARGLRSILEDIMLDIMYELPDLDDISKCIVTKESISTKKPMLIKKRTRKITENTADALA